MGLVTAQLLFVDQPDDDSVQLDVVVLGRIETSVSPDVGAPLTLRFGLPSAGEDRDRVLSVLRTWAGRGVVVDLAIRRWRGDDQVVVRSGTACIALRPPLGNGTR
jgi:hypothetical protein